MPASRLCGCQVVRQMIVSLVNSRPDGSSFHRPTCARRPGVGVAVPVRGGGHPDTHSGGGSVVHRPRAGARHHRGRPAGAQAAQYVISCIANRMAPPTPEQCFADFPIDSR